MQGNETESFYSRWYWPYPRLDAVDAAPAETASDFACGISLSGGGIRSASFCLGVLQEMHNHGMLHGPRRARYLSAVSGGSYIAGAAALVAKGPLPGEPVEGGAVVVPDQDHPSFGAGSPEERRLRAHTRYLSHGPGGPLGIVWRFLLGVCFNLVLLALTLSAFFRPIGWAYGAWLPRLRRTTGGSTLRPLHLPGWLMVLVILLAVAGLLLGLAWVGVRWPWAKLGGILAVSSAVALGAAAAILLFGIGIPHLLNFVRVTLPRHGFLSHTATGPKSSGAATSSQSVKTLGLGTLLSSLAAGLTGYAALRSANSTPPIVQNAEKSVEKVAVSTGKRLAHRYRGLLLNLAATIAGPFLLILGALLFIDLGAAAPPWVAHVSTFTELAWWLGPLALLALLWWRADITAWSLHPFYKRRLASAFALRRIEPPRDTLSPTMGNQQDAEKRPHDGSNASLTSFQPSDFPQVLVCAAANVTNYGETPTGSNVTSFVFSSEEVGGPLIGALPTDIYQERSGGRERDLTLPTAVAIAGAAFAPSMGKMTRAPLRFLLALLNLRLGVWLPNPREVAKVRPQGSGDRFPFRPRPGYLVRELFGVNHVDAHYLYVTDGGHYENLGLVELLRRRCRWIWCVDASGDSIDRFNTLGEALAIARQELGVEVEIDPEADMAPDPEESSTRARAGKPPFVRSTYSHGRVTYPDGLVGHLVVIKAGVSARAPWDVQSFYERNPQFPCDPTLNQLYTAERFDAYLSLGRFAMRSAWEAWGREYEQLRTDAATPTIWLSETRVN